jgi:glycosyltransferase involved in cell wall biosynthesis
MRLGIDLHNVRGGGGLSYLGNILQHFDPEKHAFSRICLFGSEEVLNRLPDGPHIEKHPQAILSKSLPYRLFFMFFLLGSELRRTRCNLLYSPGGLYFGSFHPFVTISRNMMPFEPKRWSLYPALSFDRLRLILLRYAHAATFRRAVGMIFLTKIAQRIVCAAMKSMNGCTTVISHGVNRQLFLRAPCHSLPHAIDLHGPIRIVYPSRLEPYKHQVEVIKAIAALRNEFPALTIELCGPANPKYKKIVETTMRAYDPEGAFVSYHGEILPAELPALYQQCQLLVFASSCENLPNTLIEALSFGIPIVCSHFDPMPEIAQNSCVYFDPADYRSIAHAIRVTLYDWQNALVRAKAGEVLASHYSWEFCAEQTFLFLFERLTPNNFDQSVNAIKLKDFL